MPTKLPRWKGSKQLQEAPGSPDYTEDAQGERLVRMWSGPYRALLAAKPAKGQQMVGWDGYYVDTVNIKPLGAGTSGPGTMTVTLVNAWLNPAAPTDEIEWIEVAKPLEQAPIYSAGGDQELTEDDLDRIAEFRAAATRAERSALYTAATDACKHFIRKLRRGQDTYVTYAPVHRRTYRSYSSPANTKCGLKVSAPASAPEGYEWLRTADRGVRQGGGGKWEKVVETTGADLVDEDLYPEAAE